MNRVIVIMVTLVLLVGCNSHQSEGEIKWIDDYNMTTDNKFKVGVKRYGKNIEEHIEIIPVIFTDDDIKLIDKAIDTSKWKSVLPEDILREEPMVYITINDETMLVLYSGYNQARVLKYIGSEDKITKWSSSSELFYLNEDVFSIVNNLVGEY